MVVCAGSYAVAATGARPHPSALTVHVGEGPFASSLFVGVEEFNPATGQWGQPERRKLTNDFQLRFELMPGSWRAYRLAPVHGSQIT